MKAPSGVPADLVDKEVLGEAAYQRRLPEFRALNAREILTVNLDIPAAITKVFGALPTIRSLRDELVEKLKDQNPDLLDGIEEYALALHYAHTEYLICTEPPILTSETIAEGKMLRDMMRVDLSSLAAHELVSPDKWKELKGGMSLVSLATDLGVLAHVIDDCRVSRPNGLLASPAQLQRALEISKTILVAAGRRRRRDASWVAASEARDRVFTLFCRSYEDARAGILYLKRKDEQVPRSVPSLWSNRPRRARSAKRAAGNRAVTESEGRALASEPTPPPFEDQTTAEVTPPEPKSDPDSKSGLLH